MKNNIFILLCVAGLITLVLISENSKVNPFLEETKKEIEEIHYEQDSLFIWAEESLENMEKSKLYKKSEIKKLDSLIKESEKKFKISSREVYKNKKINDSLKNELELYLKEKNDLEKELQNKKDEINRIISLNEKQSILINEMEQEQSEIKKMYNELNSIYVESSFVVVDTIYKIDTVFYEKEKIKKIKTKSN